MKVYFAKGVGMKRLYFGAGAALLSLILSSIGFAQSSNATLGGTVADSSGALIPGVTVTATNAGTGIVTTVVTNETGASVRIVASIFENSG